MALYLNKIWHHDNGGELVIYIQKYHVEEPVKIIPKYGRLAIFESSGLEHEVKPVLNSERMSITG